MATEAVELSRFDVPQAVLDRSPKIEGYVRSLTPIFEDPRVYVFLETLGKTVAQRRQETKVSGHISLGSAVHDVQKTLGWPDADIAQMKGRYDEIVLLFLPEFQRRAKSKARKVNGDFDEWQSIAAEELTARVAYFDWKPFQTDPGKAVDRFLKSTETSLHDPKYEKFDTRSLETAHNGKVVIVDSTSLPTDHQAIANGEIDQLNNLIEKYAKSEVRKRVLRRRIVDGLSLIQISKEEDIPKSTIYDILRDFKGHLPESLSKLVFRKRGLRGVFEAGVDKYRRLFEVKKSMLTPYYEEILDLFFQLNTGERKSTVKAVREALKAKGKDISLDNLRRHITFGLHVLDNTEHFPRKGGMPKVSAKRDLILRLHNKVLSDPGFEGSLTPQQLKVLSVYFETFKRGEIPTQREAARILHVDPATISRDLNRMERKFIVWVN